MFMNFAVRIVALVVAPAFFSVSADQTWLERPRVIRLEPQMVAPAEIVTAYGVSLDRSRVEELLLANPEITALTHIVEQSPDLIRFRVPLSLEPGSYRVVLLTNKHWGVEMIDQDVILTVVSVEERAGR